MGGNRSGGSGGGIQAVNWEVYEGERGADMEEEGESTGGYMGQQL